MTCQSGPSYAKAIVMKKHLLILLAALSLFAVLAPMGASAQGNSEVAKQCQQGGFVDWSARAGGPPFTNAGKCVSASAQGTIYPAPAVSIVREGTSDVYGDPNGANILYCFYWKTFSNFVDGVPLEIAYYHDGELESISFYNSVVNGEPRTDIIPFGKTQVIVITDLQTGEVILTGPSTFCEALAPA